MSLNNDIKSPCRICPLEDQDKNSDVCKFCEKRVDYVSSIGDMHSSMPVEFTNLGGQGKMGDKSDQYVFETGQSSI